MSFLHITNKFSIWVIDYHYFLYKQVLTPLFKYYLTILRYVVKSWLFNSIISSIHFGSFFIATPYFLHTRVLWKLCPAFFMLQSMVFGVSISCISQTNLALGHCFSSLKPTTFFSFRHSMCEILFSSATFKHCNICHQELTIQFDYLKHSFRKLFHRKIIVLPYTCVMESMPSIFHAVDCDIMIISLYVVWLHYLPSMIIFFFYYGNASCCCTN